MSAPVPESFGAEPTFDARKRLGECVAEKWTLDEVIGVGGMAVVYGATHRNGHRTAIKMILPDVARDESLVRRFLREGYLANSVPHDGAVHVLDDGRTADGSPFLVMERLFGESLDVHTKGASASLDMRSSLEVMIDVLEILEAAHAAGVVHRDIKPANIFRTTQGELKLLDFGIAVLIESVPRSGATQSNVLLGTPAFMAPEQARGRLELVGPRSDLWAVAASGLAMLVGGRLRTATTTMEELAMAALQPMAPASSFGEALGGRFGDVLDRALAFEPGDRYANATAMREALESCRAEVLPVRLDAAVRLDTVPTAHTKVLSAPRRLPTLVLSPPQHTLVAPPTSRPGDAGPVSADFSAVLPARRRRSRALLAAGVVIAAAFGVTLGTSRLVRGRGAAVAAPSTISATAAEGPPPPSAALAPAGAVAPSSPSPRPAPPSPPPPPSGVVRAAPVRAPPRSVVNVRPRVSSSRPSTSATVTPATTARPDFMDER